MKAKMQPCKMFVTVDTSTATVLRVVHERVKDLPAGVHCAPVLVVPLPAVKAWAICKAGYKTHMHTDEAWARVLARQSHSTVVPGIFVPMK